MLALRFAQAELAVKDISPPVPDRETLVRVLVSGICSTDLEIVRGYAGFEGTIGHEFVGVVEDPSSEMNGLRVVGEINVGCSRCDLCLKGDPRHCTNRTVLGIKGRDGCHAEFLTLPARNLIAVPANVSDTAAVFTEPLAAAVGILEQVPIAPSDKVAVIGDGRLGLLCAFALGLRNRNVTVFGKHAEKLSLAEKRGIRCVDTSASETASHGKFDVVVEASGSGSGFATSLDLVRPRGTIVLKSTFFERAEWDAWRVVVDEIKIVGSRCGRFAPALEILASKEIDPSDLISDEFSLSKGVEAMAKASEKGVLKVLLRPKG